MEDIKDLEESKGIIEEEIKKEGIDNINKKKIGLFDPDSDGFNFGYEKACILHKNMNILQFIRKTLLLNNCKNFDLGVETL